MLSHSSQTNKQTDGQMDEWTARQQTETRTDSLGFKNRQRECEKEKAGVKEGMGPNHKLNL